MKKNILIFTLLLISLLALNVTMFIANASEPTVIINPLQGLPGESFNFDITATSWSTVSDIEVEDPEGHAWVLKGLTSFGWMTVQILLKDVGDGIRLNWPEASITVLDDPDDDIAITSKFGLPVTGLAWMNGEAISPHTETMGTYAVSFSGIGCHYFYVESFFVVPEGLLGTASFLLTCIAGLAVYKRVRNPKFKI